MPIRSSFPLTSRCRSRLIVNELVTNAIQHSRPADEGGSVHVKLEAHVGNFSISVSDPGDGPAAAQVGELGTRHDGLGTRIVQTLARQINATITKGRSAAGYTVTVAAAHSAGGTHRADQPDRRIFLDAGATNLN